MKVKDAQAWATQLSEFEADELSRKFRDFLLFWADATEKLLVEEPQSFDGVLVGGHSSALSKGLEVAEQTMGFLSVEWIAQMLVVLVAHWTHGEQLWNELTHIEKRLVEQATAMKLAELQRAATIPTGE